MADESEQRARLRSSLNRLARKVSFKSVQKCKSYDVTANRPIYLSIYLSNYLYVNAEI